MSGPLVSFISESIHLGVGDIWAAGADDYVREFSRQSYLAPAAWAEWMDYYTMRMAVGGKQRLLSEYPSRSAA
jgi:hypothetical protein